MPTIVDPDFLRDADIDSAQNIFIDTANRTIKVRNNEASGNANKGPVLDNTGVTLQALYSFLKQEWKDDPNIKELIAYPFPLIAITPEQFEFRFGWKPADDSSRNLLRTAGWREFAVDNSTLDRQYLGVISLGNIDGDQNQDNAGDQDFAYYGFFDATTGVPSAGPFNFDFPGPVNQAVQIIDSSGFDRSTDILRLFIRQEGKTYNQQDTIQIGLPSGSTLPFNAQRFPIVEGADLNATVSDATIIANAGAGQKYSLQGDGPTIEYLATDEASNTFGYTQDLLDGPYNFGIKINSINGTDGTSSLANAELYSWVQYMLRQDSDIEAGAGTAKNGKLSDELLEFVGPTLTTKLATNLDQNGDLTGTAILNINTADINNTQLRDTTNGTLQSFPFSAGVTISFSNEILSDSANAKVYPYYAYTREYTGTTVTIADIGTAIGDANQDSANFTLTGFSFTPVNSVQNPEGLNPAVDADAYFRLTGASNVGNNTIWKVTAVSDSSNFAAITLDNDPAPQNEAIGGGALRTHPINSPGAVLIDSAGAATENNGTISSLAPAELTASNTYEFSYAFDVNSQKDRKFKIGEAAADNVAVAIRAIGLENGSWVETTGTITRQDTNSFSVVSAVERNYSDPA